VLNSLLNGSLNVKWKGEASKKKEKEGKKLNNKKKQDECYKE